jgi:hypothetical protein
MCGKLRFVTVLLSQPHPTHTPNTRRVCTRGTPWPLNVANFRRKVCGRKVLLPLGCGWADVTMEKNNYVRVIKTPDALLPVHPRASTLPKPPSSHSMVPWLNLDPLAATPCGGVGCW